MLHCRICSTACCIAIHSALDRTFLSGGLRSVDSLSLHCLRCVSCAASGLFISGDLELRQRSRLRPSAMLPPLGVVVANSGMRWSGIAINAPIDSRCAAA